MLCKKKSPTLSPENWCDYFPLSDSVEKDLNQVRCEVGNIAEKLNTMMVNQPR